MPFSSFCYIKVGNGNLYIYKKGIGNNMQNIWKHIYAAFIEADRWKLYLKGLGVTLEVSFFAALLGILIGTIAAFLKLSTRKNGSKTIASRIASAYIDIIRGTPTTVQLLIMWSGILATCKNSVLIASLTFGINSGAYVAEIVRAGILAVDKGQMEAGRSLGLNKFQTMRYIIIPQAFKSILPPLGSTGCQNNGNCQEYRRNSLFTNLTANFFEQFCFHFICLYRITAFFNICQMIFPHYFFLHSSACRTRFQMLF